MGNVDHLGWVAERFFEVHGGRFGLRSNDVELLEQITERYRTPDWRVCQDASYFISFWRGAPSTRKAKHFHIIYENGKRVARTLDLDQLIETAGFRLQVRTAVDAKQNYFIEGSVVQDARGRVTFFHQSTSPPKDSLRVICPHYLCLTDAGLCRAFPSSSQEELFRLDRVVFNRECPSGQEWSTRTATGELLHWVINRHGRERETFLAICAACRASSFGAATEILAI